MPPVMSHLPDVATVVAETRIRYVRMLQDHTRDASEFCQQPNKTRRICAHGRVHNQCVPAKTAHHPDLRVALARGMRMVPRSSLSGCLALTGRRQIECRKQRVLVDSLGSTLVASSGDQLTPSYLRSYSKTGQFGAAGVMRSFGGSHASLGTRATTRAHTVRRTQACHRRPPQE